MEWGNICILMFDGNKSSGIAAVHSKCFKSTPFIQSPDDPNQGWGDDGELMGDVNPDTEYE